MTAAVIEKKSQDVVEFVKIPSLQVQAVARMHSKDSHQTKSRWVDIDQNGLVLPVPPIAIRRKKRSTMCDRVTREMAYKNAIATHNLEVQRTGLMSQLQRQNYNSTPLSFIPSTAGNSRHSPISSPYYAKVRPAINTFQQRHSQHQQQEVKSRQSPNPSQLSTHNNAQEKRKNSKVSDAPSLSGTQQGIKGSHKSFVVSMLKQKLLSQCSKSRTEAHTSQTQQAIPSRKLSTNPPDKQPSDRLDLQDEFQLKPALDETPKSKKDELSKERSQPSLDYIQTAWQSIDEENMKKKMSSTHSRMFSNQAKFATSKDDLQMQRSKGRQSSVLATKLHALINIASSPNYLKQKSGRDDLVAPVLVNQNFSKGDYNNQQNIRVCDSSRSAQSEIQMAETSQNEKGFYRRKSSQNQPESRHLDNAISFAHYRQQHNGSIGKQSATYVTNKHGDQQHIIQCGSHYGNLTAATIKAVVGTYKDQPLLSMRKKSESRNILQPGSNQMQQQHQQGCHQENKIGARKDSKVGLSSSSNMRKQSKNHLSIGEVLEPESRNAQEKQQKQIKLVQKLPSVVISKIKAKTMSQPSAQQAPNAKNHHAVRRHVSHHYDNKIVKKSSTGNLREITSNSQFSLQFMATDSTGQQSVVKAPPALIFNPQQIKGIQRFSKPADQMTARDRKEQKRQTQTKVMRKDFTPVEIRPVNQPKILSIHEMVIKEITGTQDAVKLPDLARKSKSIQSLDASNQSGFGMNSPAAARLRDTLMTGTVPAKKSKVHSIDPRESQGEFIVRGDSMRIESGNQNFQSITIEGQQQPDLSFDRHFIDLADELIAIKEDRINHIGSSKLEVRNSSKSLNFNKTKRKQRAQETEISPTENKSFKVGLVGSESQKSLRFGKKSKKQLVKLKVELIQVYNAPQPVKPNKSNFTTQDNSNKRLKSIPNNKCRSEKAKISFGMIPNRNSSKAKLVDAITRTQSKDLSHAIKNSKRSQRSPKNDQQGVWSLKSPVGSFHQQQRNFPSQISLERGNIVSQEQLHRDRVGTGGGEYHSGSVTMEFPITPKWQKRGHNKQQQHPYGAESFNQQLDMQQQPNYHCLLQIGNGLAGEAAAIQEDQIIMQRRKPSQPHAVLSGVAATGNRTTMVNKSIDTKNRMMLDSKIRHDAIGSKPTSQAQIVRREKNFTDLQVEKPLTVDMKMKLQSLTPATVTPRSDKRELALTEIAMDSSKIVKLQSPSRIATVQNHIRQTPSFFTTNQPVQARRDNSCSPSAALVKKTLPKQRSKNLNDIVSLTVNPYSSNSVGKSQFANKLDAKTQIKRTEPPKLNLTDFEVLGLLGRGAFGSVDLVRSKTTGELFALKKLVKDKIRGEKHIQHVMNERNIMRKLNSKGTEQSFFCRLIDTVQDETSLYLLLEYLPGGELLNQIKLQLSLTLKDSVFYLAEVLVAIKQLHDRNIIYRDLKPENILLDKHGHVKLIDFGFSKQLTNARDRARTNCGTPAYAAPEVVIGAGYSYKADIWSFGILICELLGGFTPFGPKAMEIGAIGQSSAESLNARTQAAMPPNKMIEMANSGRLILPKNLTPVTRDLVKRVLVPDPEVRLEIRAIMQHKFFEGVDWGAVERRQMDPPSHIIESAIAVPVEVQSDESPMLEHQNTAATQAFNSVQQASRHHAKSNLSNKSSPQFKRTTPKQILGDYHLAKINQVFQDF